MASNPANNIDLKAADAVAEWAATLFASKYGKPPAIIAMAPGRVNLIGEHTDYNEGWVLPMAIDRYTAIAAGRNGGSRHCQIYSQPLERSGTIDLRATRSEKAGNWLSYIHGVLAGVQQHAGEISPFDAVICSSVPIGAGLSSSAALEVATATLAKCILQIDLDPLAMAKICQRAEHEFAGVPCGLMDQLCAVLGKANSFLLIDCRSNEIQYVPLVTEEVSVLIVNSMVKHALGESQYSIRREQCQAAAAFMGKTSLRDVSTGELMSRQSQMPNEIFRRARHVVTENERVQRTAMCVANDDWQRVGQLMYDSHRSLQADFEVSCDELDVLVEIASSIGIEGGVWGSRMTGGGFGGCTVSLVQSQKVEAVKAEIGKQYQRRTGFAAEIFVTRPSAGARVIQNASW